MNISTARAWLNDNASTIALLILLPIGFYVVARHRNSALESTLLHKEAPRFSLEMADKTGVLDLNNLLHQKRWIVVNFWTINCPVCREEAPELNAFYENSKRKADGPQFASINIQDSAANVYAFAQSQKLSYPIGLDGRGEIATKYEVMGTPQTFFIDPHGVVRRVVAGALTEDDLWRHLEVISQEKPQNQMPAN